MMIVLARVIGERVGAEFPSRPSEVKWMLQKMLFRDIAIDQVEMFVHMNPLPDFAAYNVTSASRQCLMIKAILSFLA
jgi:hypothetical protein